MARKYRAKASDEPSESQLQRIAVAFDRATGAASQPTHPELTRKAKRRRRNLLSDDEEDEVFEMVASVQTGGSGERVAPPTQPVPGGFLMEEEQQPGGFLVADIEPAPGGFIPSFEKPPGGGAFLADVEMGGGFIDEDDSFPVAGGFIPEESETQPGGFIHDDEGGGGGFFLDTTDYSANLIDPTAFGIGFGASADLPQLQQPTPPNRILLKDIPRALDALNLPSDSHELLQLFADAASDDEDGEATVSRERFTEACAALMVSDDEGHDEVQDEEDEEEKEDNSSDSDVYIQEAAPRRNAPRRSTRSNPNPEGSDSTKLEEIVIESSSEESAEDSDEAEALRSRKGKGKPRETKKDKKGKGRARDRVLTQEELKEAEDTFELFFEGSLQKSKPGGRPRTIGLGELKNAAAFLNEKLSDEELVEMLEYAARSGGVVDLAAFTRVISEAL
ncbi:hypothetical protein T439DRAFT_379256 [Meredithblackwellia eburnea MCA 4105]